MVKKEYDWEHGAELSPHSRQKHKILADYFFQYLKTRWIHPHAKKFRLAVVDGFAGGGLYNCGSQGSPLIFVSTLISALQEENIRRSSEGFPLLNVEAKLYLNDTDRWAFSQLQENCNPLLAGIKDELPNLRIDIVYLNKPFEEIIRPVCKDIQDADFSNVIFNLDQCGHSLVDVTSLSNLLNTSRSVEIFYTFAIQTFFTFLSDNPNKNFVQFGGMDIVAKIHELTGGNRRKSEWLGATERFVFDYFKSMAPYVSPFTINNPEGWYYWLLHFAKSYRARQVYNDILHANSSYQAHFGKSGLEMLAYSPEERSLELYLFDKIGRSKAKNELHHDIPAFLSDARTELTIEQLYSGIYNQTPAHSEDIDSVLIENSDVEVLTRNGRPRRAVSGIKLHDKVKIKAQRSFYLPAIKGR